MDPTPNPSNVAETQLKNIVTGLVVFLIVLTLLLAFLVCIWIKKKKRKAAKKEKNPDVTTPNSSIPTTSYSSGKISNEARPTENPTMTYLAKMLAIWNNSSHKTPLIDKTKQSVSSAKNNEIEKLKKIEVIVDKDDALSKKSVNSEAVKRLEINVEIDDEKIGDIISRTDNKSLKTKNVTRTTVPNNPPTLDPTREILREPSKKTLDIKTSKSSFRRTSILRTPEKPSSSETQEEREKRERAVRNLEMSLLATGHDFMGANPYSAIEIPKIVQEADFPGKKKDIVMKPSPIDLTTTENFSTKSLDSNRPFSSIASINQKKNQITQISSHPQLPVEKENAILEIIDDFSEISPKRNFKSEEVRKETQNINSYSDLLLNYQDFTRSGNLINVSNRKIEETESRDFTTKSSKSSLKYENPTTEPQSKSVVGTSSNNSVFKTGHSITVPKHIHSTTTSTLILNHQDSINVNTINSTIIERKEDFNNNSTMAETTRHTNRTIDSYQSELCIPGFLQFFLNKDFELGEEINSDCSSGLKLAQVKSKEFMAVSEDEYVAAKIFEDNEIRMLDESKRNSFLQEISISFYFRDHPNFAKIVGFCFEPCIILSKYYPMGSLKKLIYSPEAAGLWNFKTIYSLLYGVANALATMHKFGFAHCDIKPDNVLVDEDEDDIEGETCKALLTDFGITKIIFNQSLLVEAFKVSSKEAISLFYASPELLERIAERNSKKYLIPENIFASDIYSYSMLMFETISRCPPWPETMSTREIIKNVLLGSRPKISQNLQTMMMEDRRMKEIVNLIAKCWQMEPQSRPKIERVLQDLSLIPTLQ